MKIITRAEAKTAGLKRYFTGAPCAHGHASERRISDCCCLECGRLKAASPKERERRREYMRDHQRRYRKKRPDRVKATESKRDKAKRAADRRLERSIDPERCRAALRKSFQKHKTKRMAEAKAWRKKNKERIALYMRPIKVMRRAAEGRFDSGDIQQMMASQNNICAACPADISTKYHVDHIVPLSRGGTHWPDNLQLLCPTCNRSKGKKTMAEWAAWKLEFTKLRPGRSGDRGRPAAQPPRPGR